MCRDISKIKKFFKKKNSYGKNYILTILNPIHMHVCTFNKGIS